MAVVIDTGGGGWSSPSSGAVIQAPRPTPSPPPSFSAPSPAAPGNLRFPLILQSRPPVRQSTPAQQGIAFARAVANSIGLPLAKAAVNTGIDIAALALGVSEAPPTPVVATPPLPAREPEGAWAEVPMPVTYTAKRRWSSELGQVGEAIQNAVTRAGRDISLGMSTSALAPLGRAPSQSTLTPGLPAREPEGAWAEVRPPMMNTARPGWSLPPTPSQNPPSIGPVASPGFMAATPTPASGTNQGALTAPGQVKAVMPPETPVPVATGRSSGGVYTARRSTARYTRSYAPRTYSYSGYSGGGTSGVATGDFSSLPPAYVAAFQTAFNMPIESYYTAERGGAAQAVRDYQNIMNLWQARTGKPMTPEELIRLLMSFDAYTLSLGRNPGWEDFVNFVTMNSERQYEPPAVPNVSYLGMGNI